MDHPSSWLRHSFRLWPRKDGPALAAPLFDDEQRAVRASWRGAGTPAERTAPAAAAYAIAALAWAMALVIALVLPLRHEALTGVLFALVLVILGAMTAWTTRIVRRAALREQSQYVHALERLATRDDLTGLPNRRAFIQRLATEFERARRYGRPLAVVMIDLDGFKLVNDTHGHAVGDAVLAALAEVLAGVIRSSDFATRLGGDEFALILVEADHDAARLVVQRLKEALRAGPLIAAPGSGIEVRMEVSAGIAALNVGITGESDLLAAADHDLYADKRRAPSPVLAPDNTAASRPIPTRQRRGDRPADLTS